jgi:hypothetical protein
MALGFSGGLLTGLQTFGQGGGAIPADPRQRNAMQAAGVTNPLLQRFGQGLGGILGTDMSSPMDQFGAAIQNIDTSTPEGKKALLSALSKVDPISAVKMSESFRQEALDAPKRAAELARIQAQTAAAKAQAETRNLSFQERRPVLHPITGEPTGQTTLVTHTMTQVWDEKNSKWTIPEEVKNTAANAGITDEKLEKVANQEVIEYRLDEKGKTRTVLNKNGQFFDITSGEEIEITPETLDSWREVGEIREPDLPEPPPTGQPTPTRTLDLQEKENILRTKGGMLTDPIFAPYVR